MMANDLPPDQLYTPYTAATQLHLPGMTATKWLEISNMVSQGWAILQATKRVKHLRYPIVREHRDLVNVVEHTIAFAFEACPQIGNKDLCSFVEADCLAFKPGLVSKAREIVDDDVYQCGC